MEKSYNLAWLFVALVMSYAVTAVGLFVVALLMFKIGLPENAVDIGVAIIYLLSTGVGGFFIGKKMEIRRFLWGTVIGFLYVAVLVGVSFLSKGDGSGMSGHILSAMLLCLGGGTVGGMLS